MRPRLWLTLIAAGASFSLVSARAGDLPDPVAAQVQKLIEKLGDADGNARKAAAWDLREIGRPAIPALRTSANADDPQVREAVRSALAAIDRPPIPDGSEGHGIHKMVAVDYDNVSSTIDIIDGERTIRVHQQNGRYGIHQDIKMIITGPVNGKPTSQTIEAHDAEELKWKAPEAWKIYIFNFNPENEARAVSTSFPKLEEALKADMFASHSNAEQQKAVVDLLQRYTRSSIEEMRAILYFPQLAPQRMADTFRASDAIRDLMTRLNLPPLPPDAEASLERRPQERLGIYMSLDPRDRPKDLDSGLVVEVVAVNSLADRAGVKPLDVIQRVNGRDVASPFDLPAAVKADPEHTNIEVVRNGRRITLRTK